MTSADDQKDARAPSFPEPTRAKGDPPPRANAPEAKRPAGKPPSRRKTWIAIAAGALAIVAVAGAIAWKVTRPAVKRPSGEQASIFEDDDEDDEADEKRERERRARWNAARASAPKPPTPPPAPTTSAAREVARLCACLNDLAEGPVVRDKCLEALRNDTSAESKACLEAFLDDPSTQKALDGMKAEEPTPEQEVILDAENALRAKARIEKSQRAALVQPQPNPDFTGNPLDSPKMNDRKGPAPASANASAGANAGGPAAPPVAPAASK